MSSSHDDAHAFDGEPARALPDDEPRTPGWIPALGFALFFGSAMYFMATGEHAEPAAPEPAKAPPAVSVAPAAAASSGKPKTDPKALASAVQRSPEQVKELQRRIEELRKKRAEQDPAAAASGAAKPVQVEKP